MKKSRAHFNVVLRPEPEGGFTAVVPVLPGCVTYGRTLSEAKSMARDAISAHIESLKKHNEPTPTGECARNLRPPRWTILRLLDLAQ